MNKHPQIRITKEFNTSSVTVFDAWLDTGMLSQWMFGPEVRDEKLFPLNWTPKMEAVSHLQLKERMRSSTTWEHIWK